MEFGVCILFLVMVNFMDFYFLLLEVTAPLASPRLQAEEWLMAIRVGTAKREKINYHAILKKRKIKYPSNTRLIGLDH